uniref:Uncharacterized protein n=1 Tax=Triticum urartu TaxID=4572 RepID=A0A8R7RAH7_TRIUA
MCRAVSLGTRRGSAGCSRSVSMTTILRYLSFPTSSLCTLYLLLPTMVLTSSCTLFSTCGFRTSSAIAQIMVTAPVSTAPINVFVSSVLTTSLSNLKEPWWCSFFMRPMSTSMRPEAQPLSGLSMCCSIIISKKSSYSLKTLSRREATPVRRSMRRPRALGK